jgi:hypothetical protein
VNDKGVPVLRLATIPDKSEFQQDFCTGRVPGSFRVDEPDSDGEQTFCAERTPATF